MRGPPHDGVFITSFSPSPLVARTWKPLEEGDSRRRARMRSKQRERSPHGDPALRSRCERARAPTASSPVASSRAFTRLPCARASPAPRLTPLGLGGDLVRRTRRRGAGHSTGPTVRGPQPAKERSPSCALLGGTASRALDTSPDGRCLRRTAAAVRAHRRERRMPHDSEAASSTSDRTAARHQVADVTAAATQRRARASRGAVASVPDADRGGAMLVSRSFRRRHSVARTVSAVFSSPRGCGGGVGRSASRCSRRRRLRLAREGISYLPQPRGPRISSQREAGSHAR